MYFWQKVVEGGYIRLGGMMERCEIPADSGYQGTYQCSGRASVMFEGRRGQEKCQET